MMKRRAGWWEMVRAGLPLLAVAGVSGVLGVNLMQDSRAASYVANTEAESGTRGGAASLVNDAAMSGGAGVGFGAPSAPAVCGGRLQFSGNFDTGDRSQWGGLQSTGMPYALQIVNEGPGHTTAGRFELHPGEDIHGGNRTEVVEKEQYYTREGDERCYDFSIKFPGDFQNPAGGWFLVIQWHHAANTGSPPLGFNVERDGNLRLGGDGVPRTYHKIIGAIKRGQWVNYTLRVKFSRSAAVGWAEVYQDGQLVVPRHFRPTMVDDHNYLKYGIYRGPDTTDAVIFHDDLQVWMP
jgi:hypothetical protein